MVPYVSRYSDRFSGRYRPVALSAWKSGGAGGRAREKVLA
jgi:hypothetical protein